MRRRVGQTFVAYLAANRRDARVKPVHDGVGPARWCNASCPALTHRSCDITRRVAFTGFGYETLRSKRQKPSRPCDVCAQTFSGPRGSSGLGERCVAGSRPAIPGEAEPREAEECGAVASLR
jgi:hypothetical protein